jgi:hypothetical protein
MNKVTIIYFGEFLFFLVASAAHSASNGSSSIPMEESAAATAAASEDVALSSLDQKGLMLLLPPLPLPFIMTSMSSSSLKEVSNRLLGFFSFPLLNQSLLLLLAVAATTGAKNALMLLAAVVEDSPDSVLDTPELESQLFVAPATEVPFILMLLGRNSPN